MGGSTKQARNKGGRRTERTTVLQNAEETLQRVNEMMEKLNKEEVEGMMKFASEFFQQHTSLKTDINLQEFGFKLTSSEAVPRPFSVATSDFFWPSNEISSWPPSLSV